MPAKVYSALAATYSISNLQVVALNGWAIVVGSVDIPVGASWAAALGALLMAVLDI